jgi:hypothetical protein
MRLPSLKNTVPDQSKFHRFSAIGSMLMKWFLGIGSVKVGSPNVWGRLELEVELEITIVNFMQWREVHERNFPFS